MISIILYGVVIVVGLAVVSAPFRHRNVHHIDHADLCACPDCTRSLYVRTDRTIK